MIRKIISKLFRNQTRFYHNIKILKDLFNQYESIKIRKSIFKNKESIPWYTYPAIEYLSQFDYSENDILEFGSGNSTIFWSKRCKTITTIEHNKEWYDTIKNTVDKDNINLVLTKEEEYLQVCKDSDKAFDIIIIDGIKRFDCAKSIKHCLMRDTGIVILDNSDRHPQVAEFLKKELNLFEIDFFGFGPINDYTWCTSVFVSKNSILKPKSRQPIYGIGALIQNN